MSVITKCPNVKRKRHLVTRTNPERTKKHSSWGCWLVAGHRGICRPDPAHHQSPWGVWERPDGALFEQVEP